MIEPSELQARENRVIWKMAAMVLGLALSDVLVFGWPLFSVFISAVGLLYLHGTLTARRDRPQVIVSAKKAAIALVIGPIAIVATGYDAAQTEPRAEAVAQALRQFKARHGYYPRKLQELVPEFIGAIPRARVALMAKEFRYFPDPEDPGLMWSVMAPFGRTTLQVGSGERRTID